MSELSNESVFILRKLYGWKKIGNRYVNLHDVIRIFPTRLRNKKFFKKWVKELTREDLVIIHKNGSCISINKHKLEKIEILL